MRQSRELLRNGLRHVAWSWVRGRRDRTGLADPFVGPHDPSLDAEQRRQAWLELVAAYTAAEEELRALAQDAAARAVELGADYPALGQAAGLTRQGARRRWPGLRKRGEAVVGGTGAVQPPHRRLVDDDPLLSVQNQ